MQGMPQHGPVMVINQGSKRETGRAAQMGNITAGKAIADIIRTTLGPRSMLKMLLDAMGGIVMNNDGNCILREIDVSHPAAKSMLELSRAQDEEVGDGTTSVIVLAGEMLVVPTRAAAACLVCIAHQLLRVLRAQCQTVCQPEVASVVDGACVCCCAISPAQKQNL